MRQAHTEGMGLFNITHSLSPTFFLMFVSLASALHYERECIRGSRDATGEFSPNRYTASNHAQVKRTHRGQVDKNIFYLLYSFFPLLSLSFPSFLPFFVLTRLVFWLSANEKRIDLNCHSEQRREERNTHTRDTREGHTDNIGKREEGREQQQRCVGCDSACRVRFDVGSMARVEVNAVLGCVPQ